jgi:hypothetical protein
MTYYIEHIAGSHKYPLLTNIVIPSEHEISLRKKHNECTLCVRTVPQFLKIVRDVKWECPVCFEEPTFMLATSCAHLHCHKCTQKLIDETDTIHLVCSICQQLCSKFDLSIVEL